MGDVVPGVVDQLLLQLGGGGDTVGRLDYGLDELAHLRIGQSEDSDVGDLVVHDQAVLGLLGVDVHPSGDNHVRLAVGEVQVPVLVDVANIAKRRPGGVVRVLGVPRLVGVAVVLEGHLVALEVHDPALANCQLGAAVVADVDGAEDGTPDRPWVLEPLLGADVGGAVALGTRVVLREDRPPPVDHPPLDLDRARGGGVDGALVAGEVVPLADLFRELQHADEHRRHPLAVGHRPQFDALQRRGRVEGLHHHRGPTEDLHASAECERRSVVQRRRRQVHAVVIHAEEERQHGGIGWGRVDRLARERPLDALGLPGGPRRVQHGLTAWLLGERLGRQDVYDGVVVVVAVDAAVECHA